MASCQDGGQGHCLGSLGTLLSPPRLMVSEHAFRLSGGPAGQDRRNMRHRPLTFETAAMSAGVHATPDGGTNPDAALRHMRSFRILAAVRVVIELGRSRPSTAWMAPLSAASPNGAPTKRTMAAFRSARSRRYRCCCERLITTLRPHLRFHVDILKDLGRAEPRVA